MNADGLIKRMWDEHYDEQQQEKGEITQRLAQRSYRRQLIRGRRVPGAGDAT